MSAFISVAELMQALCTINPPVVIDVRRRPAFEADRQQIPGAVWLDPEQVASWGPALATEQSVVVYCIKGHEVGVNCATALAERGIQARYLEGGIEAFRKAGGLLAQRPQGLT